MRNRRSSLLILRSRGVDLRLPPTLLGFDTATVMIRDTLALTEIHASQTESLKRCKIEFRTSHGRRVLSKSSPGEGDGNDIEFSNEKLALPVKKRFSSPLIISLKDSHLGLKQKTIAESVIWLMDIPDNHRRRIHLPGEKVLAGAMDVLSG